MAGGFTIVTYNTCSKIHTWNMHGIEHNSLHILEKDLLITASFLFLIFGVIIASTLMEPMKSKTLRITYLTNPSSNFEKIFSRWLIVTVGYVIAFFIAFWLADAVRVVICSIKYSELDIAFLDLKMLIAPKIGAEDIFQYVFPYRYLFFFCIGIYTLLQSLFILGANFWEKVSFVKTFSAGVIVSLLFLLVCHWAIKLFYGNYDSFGDMLSSFEMHERFSVNEIFSFMACVLIFFALVNWTIAFFRFRESEIIKRL